VKDLSLPFDKTKAADLLAEFGSPLYVYDEAGLRAKAQKINQAFSWAKGYRNYFAVKATPTPGVMRVLHEEGMGFDVSSRSELLMVQKMGIASDRIFYTANNVPKEDFELAIKIGATVNLDDITQVKVFCDLIKATGYQRAACRYTPLNIAGGGNEIIGKPSEAKYGMSLENLVIAYDMLKKAGVKEFGLHAMVVSNELDAVNFAHTAKILREAVEEIESKSGVVITYINLGGGFGLNYRPEQDEFDVEAASKLIRKELGNLAERMEVYTENGRYVTGPHGYMLTKVRHVMHKYKDYIGLDASMHNLMRPGMYGAYHYITVLGKEGDDHVYDLVGSLCENNDKFAIDRGLPEIETGDIVAVHDTGAHGHAMGFNYNGLLRSAEVLLQADGTGKLLRRAEPAEDYFRHIVW